jgi:hypothetical protein
MIASARVALADVASTLNVQRAKRDRSEWDCITRDVVPDSYRI